MNDAIGFMMKPEQMLVATEHCFGTPDAICFRDNILRIHDLKTGEIPANFTQLRIYAAMFCIEYRFKPTEIKIELRIYQNDQVEVEHADTHEISFIIDRIKTFSARIDEIREEVFS